MSRRRSALLVSALALITLQGCMDLDFSGLDMDGLGGGGYGGGWGPACDGPVGTIQTVWVTSASKDYYLELGDSVTLTASLMDGACNMVVLDLMKSWSTTAADSLSLRPLGPAGEHAIFKPQQTGVAEIKVSVNNAVGMTSVEAIPRIQGIVMTPSSATIRVGDSVLVSAVARYVGGSVVDYPYVWFDLDQQSGVTEGLWYSDAGIWIIGRKPGKSPVVARLLKHSAISEITVVAR